MDGFGYNGMAKKSRRGTQKASTSALQEKLHRVPVSVLRVRIAQRAGEEFPRCEHRGGTGAWMMSSSSSEIVDGRIPEGEGRAGLRSWARPGIKESDAQSVEILHVARDQGEIVLQRGSREQTVYG
jgi:hypothetical protein